MAISHAQPLLLLVLVSLFFLPTLAHDFQNCDPLYQYDVKVKNLKISPYPAKYNKTMKVTITANTSKVITNETKVKFQLTSTTSLETHSSKYSLCKVTKCPVAPGPFTLTFSIVVPSDTFSGDRLFASVDIAKKILPDYMMCILSVIKMDRG